METVLSVQFEPLMLPKTAHFGLYWAEIRERFPQTAEQGELPAIAETETGPPTPPIDIQVRTLNTPPTPRFWFTNGTGTELIQVQRDRFIKNWRKAGENDEYPHYEQVKEAFDQDFAEFRRFIESHNLGRVNVNQCEVTYINHIVSGDGWRSHEEIDRVFTVWNQIDGSIPGLADGAFIRTRFPIRDNRNQFCGRLHASIQPVHRLSDGLPMFLMELTARGQIGDETQFFDIGREWIVKSFAKLTTPEMHRIWERTQ